MNPLEIDNFKETIAQNVYVHVCCKTHHGFNSASPLSYSVGGVDYSE